MTRSEAQRTDSAAPPIRVLFVGDDASSPQIAAALLRQRIAGDVAVIRTAGTRPHDPGGRTDELLVGMGLDPADEKPLRPATLYGADRVVVLGTGIDVARLPGPHYEEWDLERADLDRCVADLARSLMAPPTTTVRGPLPSRLLEVVRVVRLFWSLRGWRRRSAARADRDEIETGS